MSELPPWRLHTARFQDRALVLGSNTFEFLHDHLDRLPSWPVTTPLSDRAAIKFQACLVVIGSLRTAREVVFSGSKLWLQGHFLLAATAVRMLLELHGQLAWVHQEAVVAIERGDLELAQARLAKVIFGSNTAIPFVRGGLGPHPLVNVMDFVRAGEIALPGSMDDYKFLCDGAHPSYMLQSWLLFAGPDHDNWTNETFARQADALLERIVATAERCLPSIEEIASKVLAACVPEVQAETAGEDGVQF